MHCAQFSIFSPTIYDVKDFIIKRHISVIIWTREKEREINVGGYEEQNFMSG